MVAYLSPLCEPKFDESHFKRAAKYGHFALLQWLLENVKHKEEMLFQRDVERVFDNLIKIWHEREGRYGHRFYDDEDDDSSDSDE